MFCSAGIHEIRSRLRQTEQRVRELRERSESIARSLRRSADEYERQQEREKQLICELMAGFVKISLPTFGSAAMSGHWKAGAALVNAGGRLWSKVQDAAGVAGPQGIGKKVGTVTTSIESGSDLNAERVKVTLYGFSGQVLRTVVKIGEEAEAKLTSAWTKPEPFAGKSVVILSADEKQTVSDNMTNWGNQNYDPGTFQPLIEEDVPVIKKFPAGTRGG